MNVVIAIILKNYFAINSYNGIYTINNHNSKKVYNVKLFKDDIYTRDLSALANKYYITPDYTNEYDFNTLYRVDITNNDVSSFSFDYSISYNSYVQGVVDDKIYLIDVEQEYADEREERELNKEWRRSI